MRRREDRTAGKPAHYLPTPGTARTRPQRRGRVFFIDDAYRTPDELIEGASSSTIRRRLNDGAAYRAVKVPHRPADLEDRLRQLGWQITATATSGPCYWGQGMLDRSRKQGGA